MAAQKPEEALSRLRELRDELVALERTRVAEALRTGSSFGVVAKALGISRQAAHRRYRDLASPAVEPLSLTSEARHAIALARREAAASGAHNVTSEHLLLGVLRSGGVASRALEAGGVTADGARRSLRAQNGISSHATDGSAGAAQAVLSKAAEIARARHARHLDAEHIALAALNGPDGRARQAVAALGVAPAAVCERLS